MLFKKLKDPFLIISMLFLVAALATGGLLFQAVSETLQGNGRPGGNLHLTEDDQDFHYLLPNNATELQEELFEALLEAKGTGNETDIAHLVVKNFVADFFTWSNKSGRADVGGLQFVASPIRTQFRNSAIDDFYLYLNQYMERYGYDRLIEVNSVTISETDFHYQLPVYVETEVDEWGYEHPIYELIPVIRIHAQWTYRGWFPDFQNEAIFYLTFEDGYFSIRAMVDIPRVEEEEEPYAW